MKLLVLAYVVLLLGCDRSDPEVEFAATRLSDAEWQTWSGAGVESAHRHITIRRAIQTPPCRHLEPELIRTGSDLTLRVSAESVGPPCPARDTLWGYMAMIQNLEAGTYDLTVLHTSTADAVGHEVVLRHQVVVE